MTTRTTPLVGIFADDLTGALDAAAPFAACGFRTLVSPTAELPSSTEFAEVISVNLGTRHLPPTDIVDLTAKAVRQLDGLGVNILLNKVDSTLRGNPGIELFAALKTVSGDHAVICSAYPQNGRTIKDGVLLVDGMPVAETDVGQDQLSPLHSSNVIEVLTYSLSKAGFSDQVHLRGIDGGAGISDLLPVIIAADAKSEADLTRLARRLVNAVPPALVAGSAGISVALADEMSADRMLRRGSAVEPCDRGRRVLIVTASQRTIVEKQLVVLGDSMDLVLAELSLDEVLCGVDDESIVQMQEVAKNDGVVVLKLSGVEATLGATQDETIALSKTIVQNLGIAVRKITDEVKPDTLIIIGGDTASGVIEACGVASLELQGELQPGTVSGVALDGSITDSLLVTRAGGFGDEHALLELVTLLELGHNV
ncbi:MAG: four-carbon acid sugar kinase family protein [Chloroflexi bacterium]|nr:four-carbon acid sugar kinase family protein [Chloroflexota bacterium]